MKTVLLSSHFRRRVCTVVGVVLAALAGQPALVAAQGVPTGPLAATYPVIVNVQGHLFDVFFTPGERVERGQLLAKVERADGSMYYISAPVAGRIAAARLATGNYLSARTVLTTVAVRSAPVQ